MNPPYLVRPDVRGEGNQGFGSRKSLFKRLDKVASGKSKGFERNIPF